MTLHLADRVAELIENNQGIHLDLGGGSNPQRGFINIDKRDLPTVDIVHNLEKIPWPLPESCVTRVLASHLVEHINPANSGFLHFMDEVWRICRVGAEFLISMPYGMSPGFIQDPTHCNPCNEATWAYFDPLHKSRLYKVYQPKPWYYQHISFNVMFNMEVLLVKHSKDPDLWLDERAKWGPVQFQ